MSIVSMPWVRLCCVITVWFTQMQNFDILDFVNSIRLGPWSPQLLLLPPPPSRLSVCCWMKGRGAWGWVVGLMSLGAKNWVVRLGTSNPAFTDIFVFVYCVMFSFFLIVFQYWRRRMCQYRWLSIILACLTWRHSHSETCVADKSLLIDNTCVAWRISARVECTLCFCLPNLFSFV